VLAAIVSVNEPALAALEIVPPAAPIVAVCAPAAQAPAGVAVDDGVGVEVGDNVGVAVVVGVAVFDGFGVGLAGAPLCTGTGVGEPGAAVLPPPKIGATAEPPPLHAASASVRNANAARLAFRARSEKHGVTFDSDMKTSHRPGEAVTLEPTLM
jgi:hypothetical protein